MKLASKQSSCSICKSAINVSEEVWPITRTCTGRHFLWVHRSCVAEDEELSTRPACPYFRRRGKCLHGDGCFFAHERSCNGRTDKNERNCTMFSKQGRVGVFR